MTRSPEEYFKAQDFSLEAGQEEYTPAERAFMAQYMGVDSENVLEQLGLPAPGQPRADGMQKEDGGDGKTVAGPSELTVPGPVAPGPLEPSRNENENAAPGPRADTGNAEGRAGIADRDAAAALMTPGLPEQYVPQEACLEDSLKEEAEIQMVGFFIGSQEFTIPTAAVQEVIRHMPTAKLPAAPPCVAGVINLRGRVTPLVQLRDILEVRSPRQGEDRFIIICRRQGLQIGMLIEKVHTMYRVPQADIEWGIETHLGINGECIAGLFKQREQLVAIVSVDRVIADILKVRTQ